MIPLVAWQVCQDVPILMRPYPVLHDVRGVDSSEGNRDTSDDQLARAFQQYLHVICVALAGAEIVDMTPVDVAKNLLYWALKCSMRTDF